MNIRYVVDLTEQERAELKVLIATAKTLGQKRKRAQILLACDRGMTEETVAAALSCGTSTIYRTKRCFVEEGLEAALTEKPRSGGNRKLTGREEAALVELACSAPPLGRARWTLELLAGELVRLIDPAMVSRETIRRRLAENDLKAWQRKMWCIPKVDAEFVERMEDVLDLYAESPNRKRPVICFDETPTQLIGEARTPSRRSPVRSKNSITNTAATGPPTFSSS